MKWILVLEAGAGPVVTISIGTDDPSCVKEVEDAAKRQGLRLDPYPPPRTDHVRILEDAVGVQAHEHDWRLIEEKTRYVSDPETPDEWKVIPVVRWYCSRCRKIVDVDGPARRFIMFRTSPDR